jgi:pimeloyl-ACP methyl ester carboxylesterase
VQRSILYFHGFASSPRSRKVAAIEKLLGPDGLELNAPDLNAPSFEELDWSAMIDRGVEFGRRIPPAAVVGSSLGGLLALEVLRRGIVAPLVLIAPALGFGDRWVERLPAGDPIRVYNHARDGEAPIHRAFFEQMARVDVDREPPPTRVTLIMGRRDESVPFDQVERTWRLWEASGMLAANSRFVEIPEGDHGLVAWADLIAREIRAAATPL